jgi:hypothetical protein
MMNIFGVDFSSSPSSRKPIVIARTRLIAPLERADPSVLRLDSFEKVYSLDGFAEWLQTPGPWLCGFDFPFALPREFLVTLAWPPFAPERTASECPWSEHIAHISSLSRQELVVAFKRFCAARPVGGKFAHRACDIPAGASPSMKWVNPPVAYMLHAGATRLHEAGVLIPGLKIGDAQRVALEAYPGYLARMVLGRESYKSDDARKQNEPRRLSRERVIKALMSIPLRELGMKQASALDLTLELNGAAQTMCLDDASGDHLDAWLCAIQASVGYLCEERQPGSCYGMGAIDPLEGWIVSVVRDLEHDKKYRT